MRPLPNIAISGTPGAGKSTLSRRLIKRVPALKLLDVNTEAEKRGCRDTWDAKRQCYVLDEDKLVDALVPDLEAGGYVIDWMHADFWVPPSDADDDEVQEHEVLVDIVATVRAGTAALYDRYQERGYSKAKVDENMDAEIMGSIAEENEEAFGQLAFVKLVEVQSDTEEQMDEALDTLVRLVQGWLEGNGRKTLPEEADLRERKRVRRG